MTTRRCFVCSAMLNPFKEDTLTAHEFNCYQVSGKVPEHHRQQFDALVVWKRRSDAIKRGRAKRKGAKL